MLKRLWNRVITKVRPDRAELSPSIDFDPDTGALSVILAVTVHGKPLAITRENLRSGSGIAGHRRFRVPKEQTERFNRLLDVLEWQDEHRLRALGESVPTCLDGLRREFPGRESPRARAVEVRPLKTTSNLDVAGSSGLRLHTVGLADRGEQIPVTPDDLRRGGMHRRGPTFYELAPWPSSLLEEVDSAGAFDHHGDAHRVLTFAARLQNIEQVTSLHVTDTAQTMLKTALEPIETQLTLSVDEPSSGTLAATIEEMAGQQRRRVLNHETLQPVRLVDGRFQRLDAAGQDLLRELRRLGKPEASGVLRFAGATVPEALELLKGRAGVELSEAAAAIRVHAVPLEERTYIELQDPDSMIIRQNLVTDDGRRIIPPEETRGDAPEWLRIEEEYFRAPERRAPLPSKGTRSGPAAVRLTGDEVPEFLESDLPQIRKRGRVFLDAEAADIRVVSAAPTVETTVDLDETTKEVVVRPKYRSGAVALEHGEVKRADRQRRYVRRGRTYHRIDWDLIDRVEEAARRIDLTEKADGSFVAPSLHLDEIINTFSRLGILSETEVFGRFRERLINFSQIEAAPLPSMLKPDTAIRVYQRAGYDWLAFLKDYGLPGVLADEMGLGKTLQVLLTIAHFRDRYGLCPSLIVCPAALVEKWIDETGKFFKGLYVISHAGSRRLGQLRDNIGNADGIVTSYETLVRDADYLAKWKWRFVIADEAQRIKNPGTQRAHAIRKIPAEARIAITGTPVENSLLDLWSIFDFLAQGYLGASADFQRRYADPIASGNRTAVQALQRRTRAFVLRRLKRQVAKELPEKLFKPLRCELTPLQKQLYQAVIDRDLEAAIQAVGGRRLSLGNPHIFAILTKLKQICCHPGIVTGDFQPYRAGVSAKFDGFCEVFEEIREASSGSRPNKLVAFSQYKPMAGYLHAYIDASGKRSVLIDGSVSPYERPALCRAFNEGADQFGMVLTLGAGGVGLDLQGANYVVMYDRWWNPAVEDQAIDRVHRLGQDREVVVVTITARGTLEERIEAKLDRKRKLADQVIEADELMRKDITRDDLLELVRLEP